MRSDIKFVKICYNCGAIGRGLTQSSDTKCNKSFGGCDNDTMVNFESYTDIKTIPKFTSIDEGYIGIDDVIIKSGNMIFIRDYSVEKYFEEMRKKEQSQKEEIEKLNKARQLFAEKQKTVQTPVPVEKEESEIHKDMNVDAKKALELIKTQQEMLQSFVKRLKF